MIYKIRAMITLAVEMEVDAGSEIEAIRSIEGLSVPAVFNRSAVVIPKEVKETRLATAKDNSVFVQSIIVQEHSGFKKAADKKEVVR